MPDTADFYRNLNLAGRVRAVLRYGKAHNGFSKRDKSKEGK
jgi:hypothetical protein